MVTRRSFWLLAGANFSVALGYGAILPLLPTMLATFDRTGTVASVAWHTGALLGTYMLGLFVSAPVWGMLSDRIGGRRLIVAGLTGYAAALVAFAGADSLAAAYLWRVLAGMAGGAVLPVVNATVGAVVDRPIRARLFAGTAMATLLGLLAGPLVSGLVYSAMQRMGDVREMTPAVIGLPLAGAATVALLIALGSALWATDTNTAGKLVAGGIVRASQLVWRNARPALAASFLLTLALGAFEAVLPVLGRGALSLDPTAVSALLALCMVAMLAVQTSLFLAPILHRAARSVFVGAGFFVVATGIALLAEADTVTGAALAVGLIGAGSAFLQPAIAYLATLNDTVASGTLLGALAGAGGLGQAVGSLAGGGLFAVLDTNALWVVAVGLAGGAVWLGAADRLAPPVGAASPEQVHLEMLPVPSCRKADR